MMAYNLRRANARDVVHLAAIDARVNFSPWSEAQFQTACSADNSIRASVWLLDDRGHIAGFFVFCQALEEVTMQTIAVDLGYQGRGVGRALLRGALAKMRQSGAARCLLEVRQSNMIAQRLYTSEGFRLDGLRENYYRTDGGREDALLMSLAL